MGELLKTLGDFTIIKSPPGGQLHAPAATLQERQSQTLLQVANQLADRPRRNVEIGRGRTDRAATPDRLKGL